MSQENIEVVRSAFAAWNRGDLDAWLETFHPRAEWRTSGAFPGFKPAYYGDDGRAVALRESQQRRGTRLLLQSGDFQRLCDFGGAKAEDL
jgi:ketosteroid isomerase-like protein